MSKIKKAIVVMSRFELKYIINSEQEKYLLEKLKGHMEVDEYGLTSIASLYYDTPNYQLIRESIEKPPYKEKIRLRSYGLADKNSPVFLELKRKAYGVVYKRRIQSTIPKVRDFFKGKADIGDNDQIKKEIETFKNQYDSLVPSCVIIYDRVAYYEPDGDLRLTIDHNPRYRLDSLDLTSSMDGTSLLDKDKAILEIKVQDAMPLWLTEILSDAKIYKTSFSKYGEAFKQNINKKGMILQNV